MYVYLYHLARWKDSDTLKKGDVLTTYDILKSDLSTQSGFREKRFSTKEIYNILTRLEREKLITIEYSLRNGHGTDMGWLIGENKFLKKAKNEILISICNYVGSEEAKATAYMEKGATFCTRN